MLKIKISVSNLIKSQQLIKLINSYSSNFFNMHKKHHDINLNFLIKCQDTANFIVEIKGNIDEENLKTTFKGDDLIPIIEIALRNFRNKSQGLKIHTNI